jgi:tricorn protease
MSFAFTPSRLALTFLCAFVVQAGAVTDKAVEGYYRQPALRGPNLVVVAEGDLWNVSLEGGAAQRLTTHPGYETQPAVSPDGQWLAFIGQYDGTPGSASGDVYVMPLRGGVPKRLSWEGLSLKVWGFTFAGEVLYTGPTQNGAPGTQLYAVDPKTAQRRVLPVAQASDGALSADGKRLYFTRMGLRSDNARQYRGGAIARLWMLDLDSTAEARPLVAEGANDKRPMPYLDAKGQARVAFLSDRDGTVNVWSVDAQGQDLRQHSRSTGWDVRSASIDGAKVAYALGADVHVLDLNSNADRRVAITLGGDFDQLRERFIKKPQDFLSHLALAPNGERVLLSSRGHLATQGAARLRRAELPQPADGRCRDGEFSSDSKSVFALCDFSGEVEVWRFAANGLGKAEQVTSGAKAMRQSLYPSPDGRYLAHIDKEGSISLTDLQAKGVAATKVIVDSENGLGDAGVTWSPDGRALVFAKPTTDPYREQLQLYTLADGRLLQLGTDRYDSDSPAFTPDGKWLYFLSRRHFAVTGPGGPWGDRNMGPYFDRAIRIYALALQPGLRFPFAPPDELEPAATKSTKPEDKVEAKAEVKPAAKLATKAEGETKPALPAIVTAGLPSRLYEVPLPPGNYSALRTDGKRLWYLDTEVTTERKVSLKTLTIDNLESKPDILSSDVRQYALSADGKKLMLRRGPAAANEILLVDAAPKLPSELGRFTVGWTDWQIATDPKREWQQMFADAWRMHRDYFYDKGMHGVDWPAMRRKYEPLVARVTDRAELGDVLGQLASELGALHSQIGMPDLRSGSEDPALAGLGARYAKQAEGFRIEQIYASDPELPSAMAPLAAPGLNIKPGDVITAVNGRSVSDVSDLSELLRGQAGRQVLLELKGTSGRVVQRIVTPVTQRRDLALRYGDWRYNRGQAVALASQGRIGYLHLRAMGREDIADFAREFYAQADREGLIIDVRYNNGGNIDSWILEKLLRRAWTFWQRRSPNGSATYPNMQQTFQGQVVVLINEETYSDGETFAEGFKQLGLGVTIGKRTSGAGAWLSDRNRLIDNGLMRAGETGQILADGRFIVEGIGVSPDIEVDNAPRASFNGGDAQLDAAIALLKQKIAEKPKLRPKPGPYPRPVRTENAVKP